MIASDPVVNVLSVDDEFGMLIINVSMTFKNIGKGPAVIEWSAAYIKGNGEQEESGGGGQNHIALQEGETFIDDGDGQGGGSVSKDTYDKFFAPSAPWPALVRGWVTYRDMFNTRWRGTFSFFIFMENGERRASAVDTQRSWSDRELKEDEMPILLPHEWVRQ